MAEQCHCKPLHVGYRQIDRQVHKYEHLYIHSIHAVAWYAWTCTSMCASAPRTPIRMAVSYGLAHVYAEHVRTSAVDLPLRLRPKALEAAV